ncbi:hypothetical protein CPB84DRAFT_1849641 [Gymnopilus junonius]|uniref:Hydrophobin n=1 Tax=Gymnopilus junonius TaxID=109634 RepID=A0A9P5NFW9_GYMJU|nr:hypothetical protein CPB84DRAFT_1849641 [Gymnopilus junonius]
MFSKVTLFVAAFVATVMASPLTPPVFDSCNSGPVLCCNSLQAPETAAATQLLSLVGVAVEDVVAQVGAGCTAVTGVGAGTGANCATSPVCCQQNFFNQLIGVDCSPVNIGA